MSCGEFDWKGYVLAELGSGERRAADEHLKGCAECRAEVASLEVTVTALHRLPVMEPPRRIAFVSDPVFEPGWWARFWASGPRLGFASAAMVAGAIVVHGFVAQPPAAAPARVVERVVAAQGLSEVEVRKLVRAELQPALDELSVKLAEYRKQGDQRREADLRAVDNAFNHVEKKMNTMILTATRYGGD